MNLKNLERRINKIEEERGVKPKKYYIFHVRLWKEEEDPNVYMLMVDDGTLKDDGSPKGQYVQTIHPDDAKAFWENRISGEEISKKPGWFPDLKKYRSKTPFIHSEEIQSLERLET